MVDVLGAGFVMFVFFTGIAVGWLFRLIWEEIEKGEEDEDYCE